MFPVKPTVVPQARKYTREFNASSGKVFTEKDTVVIEIPPIANTYLTKDARIHFKFNLEFYDHSFTATSQLPADWWTATNSNALEILRKPVPMMEACGPYGFFRDVEVYDYLGNTLLEKITRHDLLASTMADFYLDSEVERFNPPISEKQATEIIDMFSKPGGIYVPSVSTFSLPSVETRVNGINLLNARNQELLLDGGVIDYYTYVLQPPTLNSTLVVAPTMEFSIRLLSFLGHGSNNFVPLHNGYRIVLKTNPANTAIKFGLPSGSTTIPIKPSGYVTIVPRIARYDFSDIKLRADLLQISPEMDSQIDKLVHCTMNSYTTLGRCEKPTIIPGNFLSANNIKISMRQLPLNNSSYSEVGFRSRTYVTKARLLYNGAVQQEYKTPEQMRIALGPGFDTSISPVAFTTDHPDATIHGTGGYLYPYPAQDFRAYIASLVPGAGYSWVLQTNDNPFFVRFNDQSGKFLIMFDLSLNGYAKNTITGIDTTKTTLAIDLIRSFSQPEPYETDIFINHDAVITVKPGEYTSVSF